MRINSKNNKGGAGVVALLIVIMLVAVGTAVLVVANQMSIGKSTHEVEANTTEVSSVADSQDDSSEPEVVEPTLPQEAADYEEVDTKKIYSKYSCLIDVDSYEIIAGNGYDEKIYPASLTKLMTLLVAVENIDDMDATFKMTKEIIDPLIEQDASRAGFEAGEKVTMKDMLYAAILCSGADGTTGLATAISGSEEEFVKLMNAKANELGLESTYFANASGLHSKNHVSTCRDMATVMIECLKNETCKKILSTEKYTTSKTSQHEDGITIYSIVFSKIFEYGQDPSFEILGGKSGYTDEAGCLLASYVENDGHTYVLVTAKADTQQEFVLDSEYMYPKYVFGTYVDDDSSADDAESSSSEAE